MAWVARFGYPQRANVVTADEASNVSKPVSKTRLRRVRSPGRDDEIRALERTPNMQIVRARRVLDRIVSTGEIAWMRADEAEHVDDFDPRAPPRLGKTFAARHGRV